MKYLQKNFCQSISETPKRRKKKHHNQFQNCLHYTQMHGKADIGLTRAAEAEIEE